MQDLTQESNRAIVERVRELFLYEAKHNFRAYDPIDVERVRTEDWLIERFVLNTKTEFNAYFQLIKALEWRHKFHVHLLEIQNFPKEFKDIIDYGMLTHDRDGRLAIWMDTNKYRSIPYIDALFEEFIVYNIEKFDRYVGNKGIVFVNIPNTPVPIKFEDSLLGKFNFNILNNYYPNLVRYSINLNLPWHLLARRKVEWAFMSKNVRKRYKDINQDQLHEYFDLENIPVKFGGRYEYIPDSNENMKSISELPHLELTKVEIKHFIKILTLPNQQ